MADRPAASAEPVRLFVHDLLVAEISHQAGPGGASPDPGQGIARGVLRSCLLCFLGSGAALGRSARTPGPLPPGPLNLSFSALVLVAIRGVGRKQRDRL